LGLVLGLLALGLVHGNAVAQTEMIIADIPFEFTVSNTTLPAGRYDITKVEPWEFVLANAKGDVKVIFQTEPTENLSTPKVFEVIFNV